MFEMDFAACSVCNTHGHGTAGESVTAGRVLWFVHFMPFAAESETDEACARRVSLKRYSTNQCKHLFLRDCEAVSQS